MDIYRLQFVIIVVINFYLQDCQMNIIENFIWMNMVKFHLKKKNPPKYIQLQKERGEKFFNILIKR